MRKQITASANKVAAHHRFATWLFFGDEGLLWEMHLDEQERQLRYNLVSVPFFSRLVRAQTMVEKNKDYIAAARCLGASNRRILARHVLPNCLSPILVQASVAISQAILLEAALSFLGLGVRPPQPSLGTMLNESRNYLGQANWFAIFPGLVLVVLLMAINFLSDGLHEILLPRRS